MQKNIKTATPESTEPTMFSKMIGRTTYDVSVYHSNANQETLYSKIIRLMKNDLTHKSL